LLAVLLALGASVAWGVADFFGPLQGRKYGTLAVLLLVEVAGTFAIAIAVGVSWHLPEDPAVWLAAPAAVAGTLGIYAYYRGMALGAISVVAPVAAVSAVVPVLIGLATGDSPSALQLVGMAVALTGVGLASREPGSGPRKLSAGVGLALLAAVGFGFYFPPMHAAGEADFLWASLIFRLVATVMVAAAVLVVRPRFAFDRRGLAIVVLAGIGDTLGNALFAASSAHGLVSVTSVLASLYPVLTVILARLVLGERVSLGQRLGIAGTLLGVALISAG
jgi:drug/metabolite transporter (DMT)-like permease